MTIPTYPFPAATVASKTSSSQVSETVSEFCVTILSNVLIIANKKNILMLFTGKHSATFGDKAQQKLRWFS